MYRTTMAFQFTRRLADKIITRVSCVTGVIFVAMCFATPALAVHQAGNIELDGNTVNDGGTVSGIDDWDDVFNLAHNALRATHVDDSAATDNTSYNGGIKDTQSINQWTCTTGGVQSKSDIMWAYGATYEVGNDLIFYAGADRRGNNGTANMAVWLFQGPVDCTSAGGTTPFVGTHLDGDLLLVAEFEQGGRVAGIKVYRWSDPDGTPQTGDECLGGILGDCTDAGVPASTGLNCSDSNPGDLVCGRTNPDSSITAAWRDPVPTQGLFEVGANLTQLIGDVGCFANAIIETRSSTSLTATLKDFVSLDLSTCGSLSVEKETVGGNATFGFSVTPTIDALESFDLTGGGSQNFATVEPAFYTISEDNMPAGPDAPDGWNLTDISCTGGTPGAPGYTDDGHGGGNIGIDIGLSDDVVCTFTNTFTAPPGAITIEKLCDSSTVDGQTFAFAMQGFAGSSTEECQDDAVILACGDSVTCEGLTVGGYQVNESVPANWALTEVNCTDNGFNVCAPGNDPHANITLGQAESITASFGNTENASIEICKSTTPAATGGDFGFDGDLDTFTLADGECDDWVVSPDLPYNVSEDAKDGFSLDSISCSGVNWTSDVAGTQSVTITPDPGESVSCTFNNSENPAYIQVCKNTVTVSGDNPSFEFDLMGPDTDLPVSTTLQNGECDFGIGDSGMVSLTPGDGYSVAEAALDGWETSISCVGLNNEVEDPGNIVLSPDESVVCTFTNTQDGRIIVRKELQPPGSAQTFEFSGALQGNIGHGGSLEADVQPGQYNVTEQPSGDWVVNSITCDDSDSFGSGSTAVFNVAAGEVVSCTFINVEPAAIPVNSRWAMVLMVLLLMIAAFNGRHRMTTNSKRIS